MIGLKKSMLIAACCLLPALTSCGSDGDPADVRPPNLHPRLTLGESWFCCIRYLSQEEYIQVENWVMMNISESGSCGGYKNTALALLWGGSIRAGYGPNYEGGGSNWGSYNFGTGELVISADHFNSTDGKWSGNTLVHEIVHKEIYQNQGYAAAQDELAPGAMGMACAI